MEYLFIGGVVGLCVYAIHKGDDNFSAGAIATLAILVIGGLFLIGG